MLQVIMLPGGSVKKNETGMRNEHRARPKEEKGGLRGRSEQYNRERGLFDNSLEMWSAR